MAACASPSGSTRGDAQWLSIQRARLRALRLHEAASHVPVAQQPRAAATAPAAQDRRNIDQIEPQRRRDVLDRRPEYQVRVGTGLGRLDVRVRGSRLDGHEQVGAMTAAVEPGDGVAFGAGVRLEVQRSGTSLFEGELTNDGQQVRSAAARADAIDCHPFLLWRLDAGDLADDLQLPLRVGAFVDDLRLQNGASQVRRSWFGYGARVGFEPSWTFERDGATRWDLCGLVGGDLGGVSFAEHFVGGSDTDSAVRWMGEAGLGVRVHSGAFVGELGYRFRSIDLGPSSTELLGDDRHATARSSMVLLQGGVRF